MPFKLGEIGGEVEGVSEIFQRIKVLLLTEKRSLPGDPGFGVAITQYIPYSEDNKPRIMSEILDAMGRYEPGVRVSKIDTQRESITITVEGVGAIVI